MEHINHSEERREIVLEMLEDVEGYIDALHQQQELTTQSQKERVDLLYMERSAILELLHTYE